jgi:Uma2 family endonuclease
MADITQIRMTVQEFMTLPESNQPLELINGELIVSPTPKNAHQNAVLSIAIFLRRDFAAGTTVISPMDVHLDDENVVQPDVFWVSGADSRCKLGDDGYWHGAPDLVVEVLSPSTMLRDRKAKFALYERLGVREYWLVEPEAKFIEVYRLVEGKFDRYGIFEPGETFAAAVLSDAVVSVNALLA